jgi:uncharacterized protein involved in type VI secretion and phage assembly
MTVERDPFEVATPGVVAGAYLATVISVKDKDRLNRVQVRLYNGDGVTSHDGPVWARVATPFAGSGYGAFMLPGVGDEVLVCFVNGDSRFPVVVGSLWNGNAAAPERLGGNGERVDRWTIVGQRGTRIAVVEEQAGQATIKLSTPGNVSITLSEANGGKIELQAGGCTVTLDTQGFSCRTGSRVQMHASQWQCTAGQVSVNAAMSDFSGVVKSILAQSTTVVSSVYAPGLGNIW